MAGIMNDELSNLRQRHGLSTSISNPPDAEPDYSDNPSEMSEYYPNTPPTTIQATEQEPQTDQQMLIIEDMPAPPRFEDVRKFTRHQMLQLFNAKYSVVVNTAERYKHKALGNDGLQRKFSEFAEKNNPTQRREFKELFVKGQTLLFEKDAVIREDATFFIWSKGFIDILLKQNDELLKDINQSKKERDMTIVEYGRYIQNAKMLVRFIKNDNVPDLLKVKMTDAQGRAVPFIDVYSDVIANIITQLSDFSKLITRVQALEDQNKKLIDELNKSQAEQTAKDNKINDLNNICAQIESNIGDKVDQLCLLSKLERTKKATEIIVVSDEKKEMSPTNLDAADSSAASSSNDSQDKINSSPEFLSPSTSKVVAGATAQGSSPASPAQAPLINNRANEIGLKAMEIGNQKMNISDDLLNLFKKTEERQKEIRANAPNVIAKLTGSRKAIYDRITAEGECLKKDFQWKDDINFETLSEDLKFLEDNEVIFRDTSERAHRWRLA